MSLSKIMNKLIGRRPDSEGTAGPGALDSWKWEFNTHFQIVEDEKGAPRIVFEDDNKNE